LGQPRGVEQAACYPGDERVARDRQHRSARPERIAGGRVSVARVGIQSQVGNAVPREVLGKRDPRSKDEAPGIDTQLSYCPSEVVLDNPMRTQQPEHASL